MLPANFAAEPTIAVINLDSGKTNCWGRRLLRSGNFSHHLRFLGMFGRNYFAFIFDVRKGSGALSF